MHRHKPTASEKAFVKFNAQGYTRQNGKRVNPGFIYGRAFGYDFISRPVIDWETKEMPLCIHACGGYGEGMNNPWKYENNPKIIDFIISKMKAGEICLYIWNRVREAEQMKKRELDRDAHGAFFDENPVRKHHLKVSGRKLPSMSHEYVTTSRKVYGDKNGKLEMNGKKVNIGPKVAQYMDGNGSGLRPLDTGCFIGTGRKIQFAKAGTF